MLGKLRRQGMDLGGWGRARVVEGSYDDFRDANCGGNRTLDRDVFVQRLLQPPNSQYHILYTTMTALLAAKRRLATAGERPLLLLDDEMGAARMFDEHAKPQERRERLQLASQFETLLWSRFDDGGPVCFERLHVGTDERDGLNGFTHASDGIVLTSDVDVVRRAPAHSQIKRSSDALLGLRAALVADFAPAEARANYARGSAGRALRVVLVDRRGSRRFRDTAAVADAVLAGCGDVEGEVEVHVVALEGLGYEAQLALLSGTDLLVGMEGQGLANMLYLPSDAAVVVLVPPGFDECAVDYTDAAALLGLAVETSLLLDAPTRSHFGPREETLEKKGYWTGAVEIVDLDLARVAEAVRRALAARARRKAAS